ncbi:hypothetical protein Tco_0506580, partial [Tanacetum coccineum]
MPNLNRNTDEFKAGLNTFIEMCKARLNDRNKCFCPCQRCENETTHKLSVIKKHIRNHGFSVYYDVCEYHGENFITAPPVVNETNDMINVFNDIHRQNNYIEHNTHTASTSNEPDIASTSNKPAKDVGPTKDYLEGLFEMANEEIFPGAKVPKSYYEAKKKMKRVGLGYESIHACINDYFLFSRKDKKGNDNTKKEICLIYEASRWKNKDTTGKKVPNKVLRYFPMTPRLKRMYGSLHTAKHMTWHATGKCNEDGKMGHPVDGKAWKEFDKNNADFAKEPRNVRLGLAADGFNPFSNLSQSYSMWQVILTSYNFPPWICMKESSFMLTLLIPGPKSPSKDIDVYLKPLVEDLSGWSGQGYFACPTCNDETPSTRMNGKTAYVGHRRFLPMKHRWRKLKTFNGDNKNKPPPPKLDSAQILQQLSRLSSRIPGTLLMNDKSKDTNKARQDLEDLGIRSELWLAKKGNGKFLKPHLKYSFTPEKRRKFCEFIKGVKLPDGFGSNFKPKVTDNDNTITSMKSHDCHIMMQRLLPVRAQDFLDSIVSTPIIELYSFFKQICARNLYKNEDGPPQTCELEVFRSVCRPKSASVETKLDEEVKEKLE